MTGTHKAAVDKYTTNMARVLLISTCVMILVAKGTSLDPEFCKRLNRQDCADIYIKSQCTRLCDECPVEFFRPTGSKKCFKFINESMPWDFARISCYEEGLVLAKLDEPVAVRSYIHNNFGNDDHGSGSAWLNARGTGSVVAWEEDGEELSQSNKYWYDGFPAGEVKFSNCLFLMGHRDWDAGQKIYQTADCRASRSVLCQYP